VLIIRIIKLCFKYHILNIVIKYQTDATMTSTKNRTLMAASATTSSISKDKQLLTPSQAIQHALEKGWNGGKSGAMAMGINVCTLMWIRTTMNYQYRYGTSTTVAMKKLWAEGGIPRFYRGLAPALFQGPLSRFGDTAANTAILALLEPYDLPMAAKTGAASLSAGIWRIFITPIDTVKTTLQVEGKQALPLLGAKIRTHGILVTFHGALAAASATAVGHFPWFFTYNTLQEAIPKPDPSSHAGWKFARNALIGFCASIISDTTSNSLRVIKTTRQTYEKPLSYVEVVKHVVKTDGLMGLFGRGLKTRIMANALNSMLFSVLWRYIMDRQEKARRES